MSISGRGKLSGLHREVREAADWTLAVADHYGVPITVTSGFRSWEDQTRLYNRFRAGNSRFPANRPGDSSHNFGLAFDSTVDPSLQDWWNAVRRYVGFEVLPNDLIHAQVFNWRQHV